MAILIKIDGIHGDATVEGFKGYFQADAFSFGIERQMMSSGEKGGTQDINIGIGELQECTISKSLDQVSVDLAQLAISGNSASSALIDFAQIDSQAASVYLRYKLDRCFVKSWSTSGDADDRPTTDFALAYNRIAFTFAGQPNVFSWDKAKNAPWAAHGLRPLPSITR